MKDPKTAAATRQHHHSDTRLTPAALAVALLVLGVANAASAQQAAPDEMPANTVVVSGIRASLQQSLNVKRNAAANVEVITAEDVGKMPDKNVADSLQRLPGVNISASAAGSGGFDENDRVSLRGTAPSLTQTTINGHALSSGDWFVLDQVGGAVGRSASYSLLPSEIVGQVIVHKTPTADLIEGGVAGTVDIITRKPLDFKQPLSFEASAQAVHATLAGEDRPAGTARLVNWKNADRTPSALCCKASPKNASLRRDGQELLQWGQISPTSKIAAAHPDLANVWYPRLIGSSLFEQVREAQGRPGRRCNSSRTATFRSTPRSSRSLLKASNYNRNYMTDMLGSGAIGGDVSPDSYTVRNGTLTSASFANKGTAANTAALRYRRQHQSRRRLRQDAVPRPRRQVARQQRPDSLTAKGGITRGTGATPAQGVYEGDVNNSGVSYQLNGLGNPATVKFPSIEHRQLHRHDRWTGCSAPRRRPRSDEEKYGADRCRVSASKPGRCASIKFGFRGTEHKRSNYGSVAGPELGQHLAGVSARHESGVERHHVSGQLRQRPRWRLSRKTSGSSIPNILSAWGDLHSNRDVSRVYYPDMFNLKRKNEGPLPLG